MKTNQTILLCHECLEHISGEPEFINSAFGENHPVHLNCKKGRTSTIDIHRKLLQFKIEERLTFAN